MLEPAAADVPPAAGVPAAAEVPAPDDREPVAEPAALVPSDGLEEPLGPEPDPDAGA